MSELVDPKIKEMVALGVAYAINCVKCMKVHKKVAREVGLSIEEMNEALNIAEGVVNGARGVTKGEAEEIFGTKVENDSCCPEDSDCCP